MRRGREQDMLRADGLVTAAEVGRAIGRTISGMHAMIKRGAVPGRKIGAAWYVDLDTYLARLVREQTYPADSAAWLNLSALSKLVAQAKADRRAAV